MVNSSNKNNKRIAKNTIYLYFRMFLNMAITLYTSRVVLKVLGIDDFGIYNVVGGLVTMFSIMSGALSDSVSRFLSIELGKKDVNKFKKVFISSVNIHIILALIVFVSVETVGLWFLNNGLNINADKMNVANWVFQFSVLTFVINLLSIPYNASIISNEKMAVYAYISIIEVVLKLLVAIVLVFFDNRLIAYSAMLFMVSVLLRIIYVVYCKRMLSACVYELYWDTAIMKSMIGFASWNFLGNIANIFKTQGVSILVNIFFSTVINAAQGVAVQVSNAIEQFSSNFMKALTPQIVKSYAVNDTNRVINLSSEGTRFSFYMLSIIILPVFMSIDAILHLWLTEVPIWADVFTKIILCIMLLETLSKTLITIIQASGNVKKYQIGISFIIFMNFPISYVVLKSGGNPSSIYYVQLLVCFVCLLWRLYIVQSLINMNICQYAKKTFAQPIILLAISFGIYGILLHIFNNAFFQIIGYIIGFILNIMCIYYWGLNEKEKSLIVNYIKKIKVK